MWARLKVLGAGLLLVCFLFPVKSCTGYQNEAGHWVNVSVSDNDPLPRGVDRATRRLYLHQELHSRDPWAWASVGAFLLPAIAVIIERRRPGRRATFVLWCAEPLLFLGVLAGLFYVTFLWDLDTAAYLAIGALGTCFLGWLGEAWIRLRAWWRRRRSHARPAEGVLP